MLRSTLQQAGQSWVFQALQIWPAMQMVDLPADLPD
jgi:hypothetical protein